MPLYEQTPQDHPPGCWRWSSHWRCATRLVDNMTAALEEIQAEFATVTPRGQVEVVISPSLAKKIEELLTQAHAKTGLTPAPPPERPRFSFGESRR